MRKLQILFLFLSVSAILGFKCTSKAYKNTENKIITGAEQTEKYLPILKGKRVGILANPTTVIGKSHLVDSLQKLGINIVKVFGLNTVSEEMPPTVLKSVTKLIQLQA